MKDQSINITLLSGGVGGAKMALGLSSLDNINLSIIGNIADDDIFHGLWVSPDIDTLIYTLSGVINSKQGWGVNNETYNALSTLKKIGNDIWMNLGDFDLGLHIYRTERISKGISLSDITDEICNKFGIKEKIILPTNDKVQTKILTQKGWLSFQEYFVREKCLPQVNKIEFSGIKNAKATSKTISSLLNSEIILIAPSNPLVSIAPILAVKNILSTIKLSKAVKVAVSPIINGEVVKGPAKDMMISLGMRHDVVGIAKYYSEFLDVFIIDNKDKKYIDEIESLGVKVFCSDIFMNSKIKKTNLAKNIIKIVKDFDKRNAK